MDHISPVTTAFSLRKNTLSMEVKGICCLVVLRSSQNKCIWPKNLSFASHPTWLHTLPFKYAPSENNTPRTPGEQQKHPSVTTSLSKPHAEHTLSPFISPCSNQCVHNKAYFFYYSPKASACTCFFKKHALALL